MDKATDADTTSPFASLESALDRTIDLLTSGEASRERRALLIEARRLRSAVGNWRSIPPSPDVREEMLERVSQLSIAVAGRAAGEDDGPAISVHVESGPITDDTAALDFEPRLYAFESTTTAPRSAPPSALRAPSTPVVGYGAIDFEPQASRLGALGQRRAAVIGPSPSVRSVIARPTLEAPDEHETPAHTNRSAPNEPRGLREPPRETPTLRERARSISSSDVEVSSELPTLVRHVPGAPESMLSSSRDNTPRVDDTGRIGTPSTLVTAEIVPFADPVHPMLVFVAEPYSTRADAYRALRRKLASAGNPRVIGVTSAHSGEGKTTFALNIALALRESAISRVLLVEANHRAPSFHKILGFTPPKCFLQQCDAHVDDPQAPWVAVEPIGKVHVMGIDPRVRHEPLIDPVAFAAGMDRLKQAGYDYIVVDCPPVLGSVDCNVITDSVEGMVITSLTMKSKRREMRKAVEQLEPAPILGVVVLDTQ